MSSHTMSARGIISEEICRSSSRNTLRTMACSVCSMTPASDPSASSAWISSSVTEGWLPVGTSKLSFWLSMERLVSGDNDGYADNLAFVLAAPNAVPEPQTLALMLLSLGLIGWTRRRKP